LTISRVDAPIVFRPARCGAPLSRAPAVSGRRQGKGMAIVAKKSKKDKKSKKNKKK
jgi:hypothetical protein